MVLPNLAESKISAFLGRCGDSESFCHVLPVQIGIIVSLVDLNPIAAIVRCFNHPILTMAGVRTAIEL